MRLVGGIDDATWFGEPGRVFELKQRLPPVIEHDGRTFATGTASTAKSLELLTASFMRLELS